MKVVRNFNSFKNNRNNKPINEEFIGKLLGELKGQLGKLFSQFAAPFKDMANDIKKLGDKTDPKSIKGLLMANFGKAVNGIKTAIPNLQKKEEVEGIMDTFIKEITELANGLGSDFDTALGKDKSNGPKYVAKAILIGDKDANWPGIVGLLQGNAFKYNITNYKTALKNASNGKEEKQALDAEKKAAVDFFEKFEQEFVTTIDKELTEEEMQNMYKKALGNKANTAPVAGKDYVVKDMVKYKTLDYNPKLPIDKQPEGATADGEVTKIDGQSPNATITIHNKKINKDIQKKEEDIIGKPSDKGPNGEELAKELGEIKSDEGKMKQVKNFVDLIKDPIANKAKLDQINKIIGNNEK